MKKGSNSGHLTEKKSLYFLEAFQGRSRELESCMLCHEPVKLLQLLAAMLVQMAERFCLRDCNCGSSGRTLKFLYS